MFSLKKVSVALALGASLAIAPVASAGAPPSCSTGSIMNKATCAFEGAGVEGSYSATAQQWAIYHYEVVTVTDEEGTTSSTEVRVEDLSSDTEAPLVNDAGKHLFEQGVVYYLEVTNGIARASSS